MLHAELHAQPVACVLYGNFNIIAVVAHAVVFTRKAEPELHAAAAFAARHVFQIRFKRAASYVSFCLFRLRVARHGIRVVKLRRKFLHKRFNFAVPASLFSNVFCASA